MRNAELICRRLQFSAPGLDQHDTTPLDQPALHQHFADPDTDWTRAGGVGANCDTNVQYTWPSTADKLTNSHPGMDRIQSWTVTTTVSASSTSLPTWWLITHTGVPSGRRWRQRWQNSKIISTTWSPDGGHVTNRCETAQSYHLATKSSVDPVPARPIWDHIPLTSAAPL